MYGISDAFVVDIKMYRQQAGRVITYPIERGRLVSLRVHEMSTVMAPSAELCLSDRGNWLTELVPFTGTEVFKIGLGAGVDNAIYHDYRVHSAHSAKGGADNQQIKIYLVSATANGMFSPARYSSYPAMKASAVVQEIASELGLGIDDKGFEETDTARNWFCPGWTYAQFIAWLADRSRSKQHATAGFLYFVDIEGNIHFSSPDRIYTQDPILTIAALSPSSAEKEEETDSTDIQEGTYRVWYHPLMMGTQGAYGMNLCYWDFKTGKFMEEPFTVDGSNGSTAAQPTSGFTHHERAAVARTLMRGVTDHVALLKKNIDPDTLVLNSGVVNSVDNVEIIRDMTESRVLRPTQSLIKMEILIKGEIRMRAGRLIDVRVNSPFPQHMTNQVHSGKYIVERVTHQVMPAFHTKIVCFRSGIGGSDDVNLLTPPRRIPPTPPRRTS